MKGNGYRTALGGLLSALSIAFMLMGSLFPFATYVVPVISSVTVLYFCIEYSINHALLVYIVISTLSIFFVPDKETAFVFSFIFGPYPILKSLFEAKTKKITCWFIKITSFNIEVFITYFLLLKIFVSSVLVNEFMSYGSFMLIAIIVVGNMTFIIYDIALTKVIYIYFKRIRPHIVRKR